MQKILLTLLFILLSIATVTAQVSVRTIDSLQFPLADSLVKRLAGVGVSVFNVRSNLRGTSKSIGNFRSSNPQFPFRSGMVFSTGLADSIPRPNRNSPSSTKISYADTVQGASTGRQLLQAILKNQSQNGIVHKTTDLVSVQFQLVPNGDSLSFRYMFGSEEYPEFVCSQFNDIFGFFIKGPGIDGDPEFSGGALSGYRNLAKLAGNGFPVSINTVNSGQSGVNGQSEYCQFSTEGTQFYQANDASSSPLRSQICFDGLTKVLTARTQVIPCAVYDLVLVVSDVGDRLFDSGVFLENGSLQSASYKSEIFANPLLGDTITGCHPAEIKFSRCPSIQDRWKIRFSFEGNARVNVDFKALNAQGEKMEVPDSLAFEPGQAEVSLRLVATNPDRGEKHLRIRHHSLFQDPGQSEIQFSGIEQSFEIRSMVTRPDSTQEVCWYDSSLISFKGPALQSLSYHWKEWKNENWVVPADFSCANCREPGFSLNSSSRFFKVEIMDASTGCMQTDSIRIKAKDFHLPQISFSNQGLSLSNTQLDYAYVWYLSGNPSTGTVSPGYSPGDPMVLAVSAPNGCQKVWTSEELSITPIRKKEARILSPYPNPGSRFFHLPGFPPGTHVEVFGTDGNKMGTLEMNDAGQLDFISYPDGLYTITVRTEAGVAQTCRIFKVPQWR